MNNPIWLQEVNDTKAKNRGCPEGICRARGNLSFQSIEGQVVEWHLDNLALVNQLLHTRNVSSFILTFHQPVTCERLLWVCSFSLNIAGCGFVSRSIEMSHPHATSCVSLRAHCLILYFLCTWIWTWDHVVPLPHCHGIKDAVHEKSHPQFTSCVSLRAYCLILYFLCTWIRTRDQAVPTALSWDIESVCLCLTLIETHVPSASAQRF